MAGIPTGLGRVIPSADPTLAAVGYEGGAAVVFGVASATGAADAPDALGVGDPELKPPQAETVAMMTTAASANRDELSIRRPTPAMLSWHRPVVPFFP